MDGLKLADAARSFWGSSKRFLSRAAFPIDQNTLIVVLVVLFGFFLRIYNFVQDKSLWGDEFFTLALSPLSYKQALSAILKDVHAPLYYLGLRFWTDLFGASPLSLRAPSLIASLLFVPVFVYFTGVLSGADRKTMGMAAILVSISPYFLQLSNEAREYSVAALVGVLVLLFFFRYLAEKTPRDGWLFGFFMLTGFYLHHYFWPLFFLLMLCLGWRTRRFLPALKLATPIFLLGLPMIYFVIWQMRFSEGSFNAHRVLPAFLPFSLAKTFLGQALHFGSGYYMSHISTAELIGSFWGDPFGLLLVLVIPATILLCFLYVFSPLYAGRREVRDAGVLFLILYIALILIYPIRAKARYFAEFAPLFYLVISSGLAFAFQRKWSKPLAFLFILLNLASTLYAVAISTDPIHREDYRAIAVFLSKDLTSDDLVIGSRDTVQFYAAKDKIKIRADYVDDNPDSLEALLSRKAYNRIVVIFYGDKEATANEAYKRAQSLFFSKFDYLPTDEEMRFGGRFGFHYGYFYKRLPQKSKS